MSSHSLAADAALPSPPPTAVILRRILALAAPTSLVAALQVISQLAETGLAARQGGGARAGAAGAPPTRRALACGAPGDGGARRLGRRAAVRAAPAANVGRRDGWRRRLG